MTQHFFEASIILGSSKNLLMKCNFQPLLLILGDLHRRGSLSEQDDFSILHPAPGLLKVTVLWYRTYGTAIKICINKRNINNV